MSKNCMKNNRMSEPLILILVVFLVSAKSKLNFLIPCFTANDITVGCRTLLMISTSCQSYLPLQLDLMTFDSTFDSTLYSVHGAMVWIMATGGGGGLLEYISAYHMITSPKILNRTCSYTYILLL